MKRKITRMAAIVLGLTLGWLAAGFLPHALNAGTSSEHAPKPETASTSHVEATAHAHAGHPPDAGQLAAAQLVPQAYDVAWLPPVLALIGGLFAAALVIGIPTKMLVKPAPDENHASGGH